MDPDQWDEDSEIDDGGPESDLTGPESEGVLHGCDKSAEESLLSSNHRIFDAVITV